MKTNLILENRSVFLNAHKNRIAPLAPSPLLKNRFHLTLET